MSTSSTAAIRVTAAGPLRFLIRATVPYAGLAALIALFSLATLATSDLMGRPFDYGMAGRLSQLYSVMVPVFLGLLLVIAFVRMAVIEKPESPTRHLAGKIRSFVADPDRLIGMAIMSALIVIFMANFAFMKDAIPTLQPFSWDSAFHKMDRFLFAGTDPWRLTFALFGTPMATTAINAVYHAWVFVIYFFLLAAVCGVLEHRLKLIFLYAFVLTWVVGGVLLAIVFSSAGPGYFARLGLGADFEPQMELLRQFNEVLPVWSLTVQEMLWDSYSGNAGSISGISAMPSMHVASSVVVTLLAFRIHRNFGRAMLVFTAIMMVGSVHLGWHYAVDGVMGALVALGAWFAAERIAGLDISFQRKMLKRARLD